MSHVAASVLLCVFFAEYLSSTNSFIHFRNNDSRQPCNVSRIDYVVLFTEMFRLEYIVDLLFLRVGVAVDGTDPGVWACERVPGTGQDKPRSRVQVYVPRHLDPELAHLSHANRPFSKFSTRGKTIVA